MKIIRGKVPTPRRIVLFGPNFTGKSTQAAAFPDNLFIDVESSLGDIDCTRTERIESVSDMQAAIAESTRHDFKWVTIDSVDWYEKLIQKQVAADQDVSSFGDSKFDYGRGNKLCQTYWDTFFTNLDWLNRTGISVILIAHERRVAIKPVDSDEYHRIEPALEDAARNKLCDWATELFYIEPRTLTRSIDAGFNKTRQIAVGGEQGRVMHTRLTTGIRAKNRLNMPAEIELETTDTVWRAMKHFMSKSQGDTPEAESAE